MLALGVGGFVLLPNYLLYIGCTAMWMGLVGLAMYLPMAALRELPLNAAGMTGLAAYLFAFVAQNGGLRELAPRRARGHRRHHGRSRR